MNKKRLMVILLVVAAVMVLGYLLIPRFLSGEKEVGFRVVKENQLPNDIVSEVIPEYKSLERALACMVDDDVYVIVTRGEKPTSGFKVAVDKMSIEEKDGKSNLIVYAVFKDPQKETAISQIVTYPISVVKTDLTKLPDTIELRIQY